MFEAQTKKQVADSAKKQNLTLSYLHAITTVTYYYLPTYLHYPGESGLEGSHLVFDLHLFWKRIFEDKWQRMPFVSLHPPCQGTEGTQQHM